MELDEFVKNSLLQIIKGIDAAQNESTKGCINPRTPSAYDKEVAFDIAVSVEDDLSTDTGAKINVFGSKVGAEVRGAKNTETVSRINFKVPVIYPMGTNKS